MMLRKRLVGLNPKLKLGDYMRDRRVIANAVNRQADRLRELEAQVAALAAATAGGADQDARLRTADKWLMWAQDHRGAARCNDVIVALTNLREWQAAATVGVYPVDINLPPCDDSYRHITEARKAIQQELDGVESPTPGAGVALAIAHLVALLGEDRVASPTTPGDLIKEHLTQQQRLQTADAWLELAQKDPHQRLRCVRRARDLLIVWQEGGARFSDPDLKVGETDPETHLREAREAIARELGRLVLPGSSVSIAVAHLTALLTGEPEPPQATFDPEDLLVLAFEEVQRALALPPEIDAQSKDCALRHVRLALVWLRQWQDEAGGGRPYALSEAEQHDVTSYGQLQAARDSICAAQGGEDAHVEVARAVARLERWEAVPALEDDDLPPDPTPTQRAGQIVGRLAQAMMGQSRPRFWVRAARDALLQWPGVEPDPTLTVTGQGDTLLSGAVAHVAAQALRGPGGEDMSHAAQALARMGAWLQQAEATE